MRIITTILLLSLAVPAFCQSPAQQVLRNVELADSVRTAGGLSAADNTYDEAVHKLRLDFLAAAKERPAELQALAGKYLEAHKNLLRNKELYLYVAQHDLIPVGLKVERQRYMTKITSSDGVINALIKNNLLDQTLTSLAKSYQDAPKKEDFKHGSRQYQDVLTMEKFKFHVESLSGRVFIELEYDTTPPAPALGRKKDAPKPSSKRYILTPGNVRAMYLQFAEADPRTKTAPALLD